MLLLYVIRNLLARRGAVLPAVLSIAAAVGTTTAILGLIEGLQRALYQSGPALNAIVVGAGMADEYESSIPVQQLGYIDSQPAIAKDASGRPMVSPEFVTLYRFRSSSGFKIVPLRGVDPMAFDVHTGVKVDGTFPKPGESALVVGRNIAGTLAMHVGDQVRIGRTQWTVTGILDAPGTVFDSEVWTDRQALQTEYQHTDQVSVEYLRLTDASALDGLRAAVARDQKLSLTARFEREFNAGKYSDVGTFVRAGIAMTILLGVAAMFTATNTLFTLFLGKMTELGTLIAIGYSRRKVVTLVVEESMFIAVLGGALGLAIALLSSGHAISFEDVSLVVTTFVSTRVLLAGFAGMLVIGGVASAAIAVNAWRLDPLQALRSG